MANINKIRVSGTTYDIQDINAPKVIELTQSEYDSLTTKDPNAFYVITDSEYNFDGYWTSAQTQSAITQSVSGKADTSAVTSVSDSLTAHTANTTVHVTAQDKTNWNAKSDFSGSYNDLTNKLSAGTNITIVDNVISAEGGGGKAIVGGRGITVTTGETADTVSFDLPIYSGGTQSIKIGNDNGTLGGYYNLSVGNNNIITGEESIVVGSINNCNNTQFSAIFGYNNTIESYKHYCVVGGQFNRLKNTHETSFGNSSSSKINSYTFGDSGNTLFTIGNGYDWSKTHNALEVRQNGDIYIADTNDTSTSNYYQKPMIKLQDALGSGGGSSYSGGSGINIDSANTISAVYRGWAGERVQYLENISTPFYMFNADDCGGQSTFQVSFYINDIQTVVEFDVSTQTYTFIEGDSQWENYVAVEWDTTFGTFKATPNTSINVSDTSCARFSRFLYSGTTENAIDGTLDRIEYIKANCFGNIEFAARDVENDLFIAPLTLNGVYPFQRAVSFSGGIKSIDGKISTQMQATPYKWMSGVTIGTTETSTFNAPSSAITFNISRNPSEYLYAYDANNNGYAFLDSNGGNPNPSDYSVVIDNGSVTVSALNTDKYITKIYDGQSELDQYVSNLQYWGYETDTIPNVVLSIKDDLSGYVETSAITSAVTSASTDAQVPSAKAVYDIVGDIETLLSQI